MAVTYKIPYELVGVSTDEKPEDAETNTIFHELDTGDDYYFTGETWAKVGPVSNTPASNTEE